MHPVRGRDAAVEQPGRRQHEGAGAQRRDPHAALVRHAQRLDELRVRVRVEVVGRRHDDGVGAGDLGVRRGRQVRQPGVRVAVGGADHEVVPLAAGGEVRAVDAEDLGGDRGLVEHRGAVHDEGDPGHVRNCTHNVVSDARPRPRRRADDGLVNASERVLVYGATGHTGRFVVDELLRRGLTPVLAGRSAERLAAVAPRHAALDHRVVGARRPRPAAAGGRRRRRGRQLRRAVPRHRGPARPRRRRGRRPLPRRHRRAAGRAGALPRARRPGPRRRRRRRARHGLLRRARRPARHRRARRRRRARTRSRSRSAWTAGGRPPAPGPPAPATPRPAW